MMRIRRMSLNSFVRDIKDYKQALGTNFDGDIEVLVMDVLTDYYGLKHELYYPMFEVIRDLFTDYSNLGYRFIPMEITDDLANDFRRILNYLAIKFAHHTAIFNTFDVIENSVGLTTLKIGEYTAGSDSGNKEFSVDATTTYGKVIGKEHSMLENSMGENAPIDADINTISSPNMKGRISTTNQETDTHSGSDTEVRTNSENYSDSKENVRTTPEMAKKYYEIVDKFNFNDMVDDIIRSVIYEFNRCI